MRDQIAPRSKAASSLAAFAETGKPRNPFERALMRAWPRIESVITEEFMVVLNEETAAAYQAGLEVTRRPRRRVVAGSAAARDELRRIYGGRKL